MDERQVKHKERQDHRLERSEVKQTLSVAGWTGLDRSTTGFISMRSDETSVLNTHPQGHQRPLNDTGAWLRRKPEGRAREGGSRWGKTRSGSSPKKQKPQLSLGAKNDQQSVLKNKKLGVLSMGRGAFTGEGENNVLG